MDTNGEVRILRKLSSSSCIENQSWGVGRGEIWVARGCRAVFTSTPSYSSNNPGYSSGGSTTSSLPNRVTCESMNDGRSECEMDTRGEVRLVRKLSNAACEEGSGWGLFKHSVWVDHGCRAVFESDGRGPAYDNDPSYGGSNNNSGGPPTSYIRACNAVDDDYGQVVSSSPLKPGHWEIILQYSKGRYVCNVGPGGDVTYFEALRQ